MRTASTESRRRNKSSAASASTGVDKKKVAPPLEERAEIGNAAEISDRAWRIASTLVLLVGACLRLYHLKLVPLHHDEGVNGNFLVTLVRNGTYHYDPSNYHGPTLYFFSAIIPWLFRFFGGRPFSDAYGLTTFNIRLITAAFGVGTIWLVLLLRKRLGTIGALSAAALIAISPGAVYLSRYFIHETLFVFFALGIVVAALEFFDTGRGIYLSLAALSAALMTATKETWVINGPVLLIALITTTVYFWLRRRKTGKAKRKAAARRSSARERLEETMERFGGQTAVATAALIALAVFIIVNVLFYSSFFTNYPKGVNDALLTLNLWAHRTQEHFHPWSQYLEWLRQEESPLLLLGAAGAAIAVWRAENRFAVFAAQWAFGSLAAYSLVGYKTPWISLNFIVPLAIISGYALQSIYKRFGEPFVTLELTAGAIVFLAYGHLVKIAYSDSGVIMGLTTDFSFSTNWRFMLGIVLMAIYAGYILYTSRSKQKHSAHLYVVAAVTLLLCSAQMFLLNFVHYDDDRYAYVYAHTRREMLALVDEVDRVASHSGSGADTGITIASPDYWPLPWYFRDYKHVGYHQHVVPTTEPLIIGSVAQQEELTVTYGDRYQQIRYPETEDGSYALRPGVDLLLYVRRDLAR
ncbi:MAG: flippase activity-associated protein Agl23 [Pyrinomonadaceae bacterium]